MRMGPHETTSNRPNSSVIEPLEHRRLLAAVPVIDLGRAVTSTPIRVGDALYFETQHPQEGAGLWRTDGTPEGTLLLHAIGPRVRLIDNVGDTVFFIASD